MRRRLGAARDAALTPFRAAAGLLANAFAPESSEEALVEVGLAGIAITLLVAGLPVLALGIPSALILAIGLGFNLRRR